MEKVSELSQQEITEQREISIKMLKGCQKNPRENDIDQINAKILLLETANRWDKLDELTETTHISYLKWKKEMRELKEIKFNFNELLIKAYEY